MEAVAMLQSKHGAGPVGFYKMPAHESRLEVERSGEAEDERSDSNDSIDGKNEMMPDIHEKRRTRSSWQRPGASSAGWTRV
jgi:hypothetical protein